MLGLKRHTETVAPQEEVTEVSEVKRKRDMLFRNFSRDLLIALENDLAYWPAYHNGNPLPGVRSRFFRVARLNHKDPQAQKLCDLWMDLVGWYVVGRHCFTITGNNVVGPRYEGDGDFPFYKAKYDRALGEWQLNE